MKMCHLKLFKHPKCDKSKAYPETLMMDDTENNSGVQHSPNISFAAFKYFLCKAFSKSRNPSVVRPSYL